MLLFFLYFLCNLYVLYAASIRCDEYIVKELRTNSADEIAQLKNRTGELENEAERKADL